MTNEDVLTDLVYKLNTHATDVKFIWSNNVDRPVDGPRTYILWGIPEINPVVAYHYGTGDFNTIYVRLQRMLEQYGEA